MRFILLLVNLRYPLENSAELLEELRKKLPSGSAHVVRSDKMVAYLIPPVTPVLGEIVARAIGPLRRVADWHIFGLTGDSQSMNGSMDPVETWLNDYRPGGPIRKRRDPKNLPLSQRGQPRAIGAVKNLVSRASGQMRLDDREWQTRPK